MENKNEIRLDFPAIPENEGLARMVVSAFLVPLNPTIEEMADVKTAVSEAVTNAIVHGYEGSSGMVTLRAAIDDRSTITVEVRDSGRGIADVPKAMEPFFTTHPEQERSGMGFAVMQTFMDDVDVESAPGKGTIVRMSKRIHAGGGW